MKSPFKSLRVAGAALLALASLPSLAADKSGYVKSNGVNYYYEITGQGDPLVLLHGGLGSSGMFAPIMPALTEHRQVITVDLYGHGRTALGSRPFSLVDMGDDVANVLKQLGVKQADVLGYSLGGGVAFRLAVQHPEAVRRLVLVSAGFSDAGFYPEIRAQQNAIGANFAEQMKQTPMYQMYSALAPRPQDWARLLDKIGELMKKDFDVPKDAVAGIKATTLVVAGDADIFPPSHAVEVFGLLGGGQRDGGWDGSGRPKSRLAILPGQTHYTMFNAPALADTVIAFLDDTSATATGATTPNSSR